MSDIGFENVEKLISEHLADFATRRAAHEAQLEDLTAKERAFKDLIRRAVFKKKKPSDSADVSDRAELSKAPHASSVSPRKRIGRKTILEAAMNVLKNTQRPMTRPEIKAAIEAAYPDDFTNLKIESMYPFLREIGRKDGFTFDPHTRALCYTGDTKVAA